MAETSEGGVDLETQAKAACFSRCVNALLGRKCISFPCEQLKLSLLLVNFCCLCFLLKVPCYSHTEPGLVVFLGVSPCGEQ